MLLLFQQQIADYLNLPDSALVALLAVGAAFYVPLGSRRGYIQGTYGFLRLAINLVLEGAVRLGGSYLLIWLGLWRTWSHCGQCCSCCVGVSCHCVEIGTAGSKSLRFPNAIRETTQALIFFSGQVLINNCDIVLVKHFFSAQEAGSLCGSGHGGSRNLRLFLGRRKYNVSPRRRHSKRGEKGSQSYRNVANARVEQRIHSRNRPVHRTCVDLDDVIRVWIRD